MSRDELLKLLLEGKSTRTIAKELGIGKSTVSYWIKKYNLNEYAKHKKHKSNYNGQYIRLNKFKGLLNQDKGILEAIKNDIQKAQQSVNSQKKTSGLGNTPINKDQFEYFFRRKMFK